MESLRRKVKLCARVDHIERLELDKVVAQQAHLPTGQDRRGEWIVRRVSLWHMVVIETPRQQLQLKSLRLFDVLDDAAEALTALQAYLHNSQPKVLTGQRLKHVSLSLGHFDEVGVGQAVKSKVQCLRKDGAVSALLALKLLQVGLDQRLSLVPKFAQFLR